MEKALNNSLQIKTVRLGLLKSVFLSLLHTAVLVLLFAGAVKIFGIEEKIINPINVAIKFLSIYVGVRYLVNSMQQNVIYGAIVHGLIYAITAYLLFGLLAGNLTFDVSLLNNIIVAVIFSIISAIIVLALKRRKQKY